MKSKEPLIYIVGGKARHGKDTVSALIKEIYEEENKKVLNLQYSSYIKEYAKKITDWDGSEETKPRELLQQLGTEVIRQNIDFNFFVKRIIGDLKVYSFFFDVLTISDARAKIEFDVPKKELDNVISIKVTRPDFDNGLSEEQKNHFTEIDLDDYDKFDYVIINDGTFEDLYDKVREIIKEVENES